MKVFPAWAEHLGLDAEIKGIDLPLDDAARELPGRRRFPQARPAVARLRWSPRTSSTCTRRPGDLFDRVGPDTEVLDEVSSISKRGPELWGHAMDPITCGLSLEAIVDDGYWARTGGELLLLGAGGSSLALTLYLHRRALAGQDVPSRWWSPTGGRVGSQEMQEVHRRLGIALPVEYHLAPTPDLNDARVAALPPHSVVANATGLGKDRPGSPLTDAVVFPQRPPPGTSTTAATWCSWTRPRRRPTAGSVRVVDGWIYFIHGWTRVIAEVFDIDIPTPGPHFDELSRIALDVTASPASSNRLDSAGPNAEPKRRFPRRSMQLPARKTLVTSILLAGST